MEEKQRIEKALKPLLTKKNINFLSNLYGRWQDEKEYEDFAEYAKAMKKMVATTKIKFIKAAKRPFGFIVDTGGETHRYIQVYINSRYIGWKAVKR